MTYFRVDDRLHDHRKSRRARKHPEGGRSAAAIGLWVLAGSWSMANGTDGWIPADELDRWDDQGEALAEALVAAELWHPEDHDGEPGYVFHEWDEWQHSQAYLEARRERNARRMRTKRANERAEAEGEQPAEPERLLDAREALDDPVVREAAKAKRKPADPVAKAGDDFARFWQLYPRKVGKTDAARAFTKALRTTDVPTIAAGLRNALQVWKATGTEPQYVPHPATWLNQGRWADEVPLDGMPGGEPARARATVTACTGGACPGERHEWTEGRNRMVCMGDAA